ncbi:MAG: transporter substrate-binding domain-containing protein [Clostridia bacterium]|nr:transporter substrate-binding domain-containing protein [Clostridia bacterium]
MKKILALILAALRLVSFAACAADPAETATAPADDATNETAANDEAKDDAKSVVVGYTIYEPMNYEENGKLVGFDTELAEAVYEKLGYKVVFKLIDWDQKYTELNSGAINCIWNGFTANTKDDDGVARADKVDFSYNYMGNKQVIVAKADFAKEIKDTKSFAGKVGAVENGSAGDTYLGEELEGAIKKGVTSQLDAMKELSMGTVAFVVVDEQLAKAYVGKGDYADLEISEKVFSDAEYYAIGFKKGSDLTAKVNGALEELAADGTIEKLAKKYGVENTAITDFSDQK